MIRQLFLLISDSLDSWDRMPSHALISIVKEKCWSPLMGFMENMLFKKDWIPKPAIPEPEKPPEMAEPVPL